MSGQIQRHVSGDSRIQVDMDPPRLSREAFWFCLGVSIAIFLVVDNPLLDDPFDITASIIWSYLAIPVLVAAFLVIQRKWSARSLVLESILLVTIKFGITYVLATVLWIMAGDPPPPESARPHAHQAQQKIDRAYTVSNDVVAGAVVLTAGPTVSDVVQISPGQSIVLAPPDERLHTAFATRESGAAVFNLPLPSGKRRTVTFHEAQEILQLRCTVHPSEHYPSLVVRPIEP